MSDKYNFNLIAGSSANFVLYATNSDSTYINLSGFSCRGQVRYSYSSPTVLFNLPATIDPSYISGRVNISITGNSTTGIPCGTYVHDLEIFTTGSNGLENYTSKFLRGYVFIDPEVTR